MSCRLTLLVLLAAAAACSERGDTGSLSALPPFQLHVAEPGAQGGYKLFTIFELPVPPLDRVPVLLLVDAVGEIVWSYRHPGPGFLTAASVNDAGNLFFIARRPDGNGSSAEGVAYEMTWDGDVIWRSRPGVFAHHDVHDGPDGGTMYLRFSAEEYDGASYEGDVIEIVDPLSGDLFWSWNIFDYFQPGDPDLPGLSGPGLSGLGDDWSHSNAIFWDAPRRLIWLSIRHFDRVIGIDYPSGVIRYELGGGLVSHQHAPEVQADGSILLFDNGNGHDPRESTVKIFDLDEMTGVFTERFRWGDDPPRYDRAIGDANRQPNGNILATFGTTADVIEITPLGEKVWHVSFDDTGRWWIYRAVQVPPEKLPLFR